MLQSSRDETQCIVVNGSHGNFYFYLLTAILNKLWNVLEIGGGLIIYVCLWQSGFCCRGIFLALIKKVCIFN